MKADNKSALTGFGVLPGDSNLGRQPSVFECFSTLTRKQWLWTGLAILCIGAGIGLYLVSGLAM